MSDQRVVRGKAYRRYDVDESLEGTPIQFVGVHAVRWREINGVLDEPTVAFCEYFPGKSVILPPNDQGGYGPFKPWMVPWLKALATMADSKASDQLNEIAQAIRKVIGGGE